MTSPMFSSGVTTSTAISGIEQGRAGLACGLLEDVEPAILKAISEESTSWYCPSRAMRRSADHGVAGEHAVLRGVLHALVDQGDVLARDAPTCDLVLELVGGAVGALISSGSIAIWTFTGQPNHRSASCGCSRSARRPCGSSRGSTCGLPTLASTLNSPHPVDQDLQVELTHARDDRLTGLLVEADLERQVPPRPKASGWPERSPGRSWSSAR